MIYTSLLDATLEKKNSLSILLSLLILLIPHVTGTMLSNETDRLALFAFKDQIIDDQGSLSSWNTSLNYCEWLGVTCGRRHQRVVGLDLQSKRLVGSIPSSIGNLSFIRSINLQDNHFRGYIPTEIGRLFRLQYLTLGNNNFEGEIPTILANCSELKEIDFLQNDLVGTIPEKFGSLSKLTFLQLFANNLEGIIPASLSNLTFLKVLSLGRNYLDGTIPDSFGQLTNMVFFGIGENNVYGEVPIPLYNISSLISLIVSANLLTGSLPSDIGHTLPNLEYLSVGGNLFYGPFPISLSNASKITTLDLPDSSLYGPVPIDLGTKMVNLEWLNLGNNNLTNDLRFLDSLTNCTKLTTLSMHTNGFRGALPDSISNLSINLQRLDVDENQFTHSIPAGLSKYINLYHLALGYNRFSSTIPFALGKLQNLQHLDLRNNQLGGPIPSSIGNISKLFQLDLQENRLAGNISFITHNVKGLQKLNLSHNSLNGTIPTTISLLSNLLELNLGNNFFAGYVPMEIGSLVNLQTLDLSKNKLSGEIPSILANCLTMEILHLEGNLFRGSIPSSFGFLRGITYLDISRNNLTGHIPTNLKALHFLKNLNLSFNSLEGELPTEGVFKNISAVSILGNVKLCGGIPKFQLPSCSLKDPKNQRNQRLKIFGGIFSVVVFSTLITLIVIFWRRRIIKKSSTQSLESERFLRLSYGDLLKATDKFSTSNLLGCGSFGVVYKGTIPGVENVVAVKVLNLQQVGALKGFIAECEALRKTRHRNLLKIITACSSIDFEGNEFKALVFDFMPNGSLENWLHQDDQAKNLDLTQRLNIARDVVSALDYLHHHCYRPIAHCDLKSSNILLDEDLTAHVADFGLARFLNSEGKNSSIAIKGSIGYIAPEYGMGRMVSTKGDVYSYGILLLELVTGKRPTDEMFNDGLSLHTFCKRALPDHVMEIVDVRLLLEEEPNEAIITSNSRSETTTKMRECMISLIRIGVSCSTESPNERLAINDVLAELNIASELFCGVGIHRARRNVMR